MLSAPVWRGKTSYAWYGIGLLIGALGIASVGAALGGVVQGMVPRPARLAMIGILAAIVVVREAIPASLRIPENRRLVPEHISAHGRVLGPLQFGFEMGTGVRTYSPSALPHLLFAALVLVVPPYGALPVAAGFASGRWIMAVVSNRYDDAGGWTDAWQLHRRPLAAMTSVGAVTALAIAVLALAP